MTALPILLTVVFSTVVTGLFNLSESMPMPVALLAGAAWGVVLGLLASWLRSKPVGVWLEDGFVALGAIGFAFAGCGGLELLIVPVVVVLGWRPGVRRLLIVGTAAAYFAMRLWTYVAFAPAWLSWADEGHSKDVLTAAERTQAARDLMLNDPRWILLLALFAMFLVALWLRAPRRAQWAG